MSGTLVVYGVHYLFGLVDWVVNKVGIIQKTYRLWSFEFLCKESEGNLVFEVYIKFKLVSLHESSPNLRLVPLHPFPSHITPVRKRTTYRTESLVVKVVVEGLGTSDWPNDRTKG